LLTHGHIPPYPAKGAKFITQKKIKCQVLFLVKIVVLFLVLLMIHKKLRICPQPVISLVGNNGDVNNLVFSMDDQNEEYW
jgi:hypothetical protein